MKTHTINTYSFTELSDAAKQTAIEQMRDINCRDQWWDCTYEDAAGIGLKITSFGLDRNRHAEGELTLSPLEVAANIIRDHGDECDTHKIAQKFLDEHDPIFAEYMAAEDEDKNYELEGQLQDIEEQFLADLLEEYAYTLQAESEYLYSDEAVIDTIEANDYQFTENGKLF
jgi:hypothetical protein